MRKRAVCFMAALLLLLPACLSQTGGEEDGLRLWFAAPAERQSREVTEALGAVPYAGTESVPALLAALLAGPPQDSELVSLIPPETGVVSWSVEGRTAQVELSEAYTRLSGVDLTLADYCITLTLCQLPGVDGVRITAEGGGQSFQDRQVLQTGDVIFSDEEEQETAYSGSNLPVESFF